MKMNRTFVLVLVALFITLGLLFILFRSYAVEDSWVRNGRGVWIKQGTPSIIPDYVSQQQEALLCANRLFSQERARNVSLNSQCLGECDGYAVDIVHNPRTEVDDLQYNQCSDYLTGILTNFIEIDTNGNIVRVKD